MYGFVRVLKGTNEVIDWCDDYRHFLCIHVAYARFDEFISRSGGWGNWRWALANRVTGEILKVACTHTLLDGSGKVVRDID